VGPRRPSAGIAYCALVAASACGGAAAELRVTARDYSFEALDRATPGRVTLRLVNRGAVAHQAAILALDHAGALEAFFAAIRRTDSLPAGVRLLGATPGTGPGAESSLTLLLPAGDYLLVCLLPGQDGAPHVMRGMVRRLLVAARSDSAP